MGKSVGDPLERVVIRDQTGAADLFDFHFKELTLTGAYGRGTSFRRVLPLLDKIGGAGLVTDHYPLERIVEAFAHAAAGRGLKTAINPGMPSSRSHA